MFEASIDSANPFNVENSLFLENYPLSQVDKIQSLYPTETPADLEFHSLPPEPLSSIDDPILPANVPNLTTDVLTGVSLEPGNTLATARDLGNLTTPQIQTEFVDVNDWYDYYRIQIENPSSLTLSLEGIGGDADLALIQDINQNGFVEYNEILNASYSYTSSEQINLTHLDPGFYYVRVSQWSGAIQYTLSLTANPVIPATSYLATGDVGFNVNFGYGLIDASAAVAAAIGQPTGFVDVPDLTSVVGLNNTTNLNQIQVPEVWNQGITGEGIVVAVLDSGVDVNHPDLINNIWLNADEVPNNGIDDDLNGYIDDVQGYDFEDNDSDPTDIDGHGTHVAGIIAAARDGVDLTASGGSYEVSGVAYNAEIMPVRVFSDVGGYKTLQQQDAAVANGIRYAVDNGASVINMSFGMPFLSSILWDLPLTNGALSYAAENNVVAVIAAGNEGNSGGTFPTDPALQATTGNAIAVGAVDSNSWLAEFSNPAGSLFGSYPYVVAPGVAILSTTPNDGYAGASGTSMAAPHVAGVVALMQQANPNLTPAEIATLLAVS